MILIISFRYSLWHVLHVYILNVTIEYNIQCIHGAVIVICINCHCNSGSCIFKYIKWIMNYKIIAITLLCARLTVSNFA